MKTFYLIAGEASGDTLGAGLMRALREQAGEEVRFFGIGGEKMEAEGLRSLFPHHELSLFGIVEVLPHAIKIMARIEATVEDIKLKKPDALITIDVPGFNLRVVKRLRKQGMSSLKCIHYVAPTVWAYRPQRAAECAELFNHMMVLLPFEPPYFTRAGLPCTFVGHPVVWKGLPKSSTEAFRQKYDIAENARIFTLLPGSRAGEIKRHMPIFAQALSVISADISNIVLAVPVPKRLLESVVPYFQGCPFRVILIGDEEEKQAAFAASEFAIAKSGTVTLEIARAGTPMIVTYKTNPITAWILKRKVSVKYVNLINLMENREIIPELLQDLCTPLFIASASAALLNSPERQAVMKEEMALAIDSLQAPNDMSPSVYAAQTVLSLL